MADLVALRKRAIAELNILFNKPPTEENIAYMMGLYASGVDTVSFALNQINIETYDQMFPKLPGDDVNEEDLINNGYYCKKDEK